MAAANARRRWLVELCLFSLEFCGDPALWKHQRCPRKLRSGAPSSDEMTLLIFVAGLTVPFRFVSTVTDLQHRFAIGPSRAAPQVGLSRDAPTGIAGWRLPHTWASA